MFGRYMCIKYTDPAYNIDKKPSNCVKPETGFKDIVRNSSNAPSTHFEFFAEAQSCLTFG
jgi:hypothetical protein